MIVVTLDVGHSKSKKSTRVAVIGASAACKRSVPSHRRASPEPSPVVPARLRLPLPYNLPFPPGNVNLLHTGNSNLSLPIYVLDFSRFAFDDCLA